MAPTLSPKQDPQPALGKRKREDDGAVEDESSRTAPTESQTSRLLNVLKLLEVDLLEYAIQSEEFSYPSLRQALKSSPVPSFDNLRAIITSIRQSTISALPSLPPLPTNLTRLKNKTTEDEAAIDDAMTKRLVQKDANKTRTTTIDRWVNQALALLDEMEYGKKRGRRGLLPLKQEGGQSSSKVVLHRTLGGTLDVFSSANIEEFGQAELEALSEVKDTDLISLSEELPLAAHGQKSSQLGQISLRPKPSKDRTGGLSGSTPQPRPVTFLQYDTFSSFAPTYDSTNAQLSYTESVNLRAAKQRLREHESKDIYTIQEELQQQQPTSSNDKVKVELDEDTLRSLEMTRSDFEAFVDDLPSSQASQNLTYQASILKSLQAAQWERLRKGLQSQDHASSSLPGPSERSDAETLLQSMVEMISESNITPKQLIHSIPSLRRTLTCSSLGATRDQDGPTTSYPGLLAQNDAVSVKESTLITPSTEPAPAILKKKGKKKRTSNFKDEYSPEPVVQPRPTARTLPKFSLDSLASKEETRLARGGN